MKKHLFNFDKFEMYSYFNKSSHIIYQASKSCYRGKLSDQYKDILKYISDRIKVGHESVIEHSNFFVAAKIPDKYMESLIELLDSCRYLNTRTKRINIFGGNKSHSKNAFTLLNIGGSIRGWKELYRRIEDLNNPILRRITEEIYVKLPKEYFIDFINDGVFEEKHFCEIDESFTGNSDDDIDEFIKELDSEAPTTSSNKPIPLYNNLKLEQMFVDKAYDKIDIINIDLFNDLLNSGIPKEFIIMNSLADMLTITVDFKGLARYSTHQLVRHRDGITQESQRYVDYSNMPVNNPVQYNPAYDSDKKYKITSSPYIKFPEEGLTADQLCEALQPIYKDLKAQGMRPEEARGYSPFATACGHLYMTFTYRNLAKFLQLRTDNHAQGEIRVWANELHKMIGEIPRINYLFDLEEQPGTLSNRMLLPRYLYNLTSSFDHPELDEEIEDE